MLAVGRCASSRISRGLAFRAPSTMPCRSSPCLARLALWPSFRLASTHAGPACGWSKSRGTQTRAEWRPSCIVLKRCEGTRRQERGRTLCARYVPLILVRVHQCVGINRGMRCCDADAGDVKARTSSQKLPHFSLVVKFAASELWALGHRTRERSTPCAHTFCH